VRADLALAGKVLVLPTLALVLAAASFPGRFELAARVYALVLATAALGLALAALRRAYPPAALPHSSKLRSGSRPRRPPPTLARLENECLLGMGGSFDLHYRLRPRLREIAAPLLAIRRGVSLDGDPEAARRLLGEESWELLRADHTPPEDRLARGVAPATLRSAVETLERL
jgi:hypothetical protein